MTWWIAGGALVLLIVGLQLWLRRKTRSIVLPSSRPRRLGPDEADAGEVVTNFDVGVTLKDLVGHSTYSVDCNDYTAGKTPLEKQHPLNHSFWRETDEAKKVRYGHFHRFQVFKDGRVGASACGHYAPGPEDFLED